MSDKNKPKRDEAHLYAKLPREKLVAFDVEVARRQIKRPEALAEAVELWLKTPNQKNIKRVVSDNSSRYHPDRLLYAVQKSSEAIRVIGEIITELRAASEEIEREDGDKQRVDELQKAIDDARQTAEHFFRQAALSEEDVPGSEGEDPKRKRSGD